LPPAAQPNTSGTGGVRHIHAPFDDDRAVVDAAGWFLADTSQAAPGRIVSEWLELLHRGELIEAWQRAGADELPVDTRSDG
jgi:hypothetical protein